MGSTHTVETQAPGAEALPPVHAMTPTGVRVFDGPGLTRRPRVDEILVSRTDDVRMTVTRFDSVSENIVHVHREDGRDTFFIWRLSDCLNRLVRHEENV